MYYESYLELDLGSHPARPRPARQLLRDPYLLHQCIMTAFGRDPRPEPDTDARIPRSQNSNWVLFRVMLAPILRGRPRREGYSPDMESPTRRIGVLVRSGQQPDWNRAFRRWRSPLGGDSWLHLVSEPVVEIVEPRFTAGDRRKFSLRANPTVKKKDLPTDTQHKKHRNGYRVSLCYPSHAMAYLQRNRVALARELQVAAASKDPADRPAQQALVSLACTKWIELKGPRAGFHVEDCGVFPEPPRILTRHKRSEEDKRTDRQYEDEKADEREQLMFRPVLFEGTLRVADPSMFHVALSAGVGPGKAFGFGLLSIGPL